jgi:head-tail adaptor
MMIASQYDEKIDVNRDNGSTGSDGIWSASWTRHLSDVPCKIQWSSGQDVVIRDRITSKRDAIVFCAVLDITTKDRIEYDSELYNIDSIIKPANRFMKIAIKRNTEEDTI